MCEFASRLPVYIINAFVDPSAAQGLHSGNPAAVILLTAEESQKISDDQRQSIARELNLSETSYVTRTTEALSFELRWFTPAIEVALCGHATLAAAEALLQAGWVQSGDKITFTTRKAGKLEVDTRTEEKQFQMEFPLLDRRDAVTSREAGEFCAALGVGADHVEEVFRSDYDTVVLVRNEDIVRSLDVDFEKLAKLETRGVLVASKGQQYKMVSRFFAPRAGIREDPVTGSAHCILAAIFLQDGESATANQLSTRGGLLTVGRRGRKVELGGRCRVFMHGEVRT